MRGKEWCAPRKIPLCAPTTYSASAERATRTTAISTARQKGRSSGSVAYASAATRNKTRYSPFLNASRTTSPPCSARSALRPIAARVAPNATSIARTGNVRRALTSVRPASSATIMPTSAALSVVTVVGPT